MDFYWFLWVRHSLLRLWRWCPSLGKKISINICAFFGNKTQTENHDLFDCRRERTYFFELFFIKTKVQILRPTRRVSDTHNVSLQMWPWPGRMGTILGPLLGQSARWQTTLMWPWLGHLLPACTSIRGGGDFGYVTLVNGDGQGLGQGISINIFIVHIHQESRSSRYFYLYIQYSVVRGSLVTG